MNPLLLKAAWKPATAVAVVVVGALWLSKCQGDRWIAERDALTKTADSLRAETRIDSALAREAARRADSLSEVAAEATQRAATATRDADRLRALRRAIQPVASNPAAPPTVSDTLVAVDSALTLCEEETTVLRVAIDFNREAVKAGEFALAEVRSALTLETQSSAALRVSNADLSRMLASAAPPCRIAFWPCPSRTVVAVGSALATYLIVRN